MTILEALVQLRDDLKLWVANNLRVKLDRNLGTEESGKFLITNSSGEITTTSNVLSSIGITATVTELNYMDGVASNVQTQLNSKAAKATTLAGYGITDAASKAYVDELIEGLSADGTADAAVVQAALNAHINDTSNPHSVTLSQLGINDVELITVDDIDTICNATT